VLSKFQIPPKLIQDLKEIQVNNNTKLASFDILNMYSNIPIIELKEMLFTTLKSTHIRNNIIQDLTNLYNLIVERNYFAYEDKLFRQKEGLAM
jgi:hypothetical protein